MSFFSAGLSGMMNKRRGKLGKKAAKKDDQKSSDKTKKKDEGKWEMFTDTYGRPYWKHSKTGEWSFAFGGGLVSPVGTVNPSPVVGYPGAVFTPSPVFAPPPMPPPAKKEEKKDDDKKKGKGWWETMYDDHGDRYFEHTVTKKITYKDPYV